MAFVSSNYDTFSDDIDQLLYDEDYFLNFESGDESRSNAPPELPKPADIATTSTTPKKKKPYQRYTPEQIQRLQEFFDQTTHPDEEERRALGEELGLDPMRVKFWFQNRRSQTKKKNEKETNAQLKDENEKLRAENEMVKHALMSMPCQKCGCLFFGKNSSNAELLRAENDLVKHELFRFSSFVEDYCGKEILSFPFDLAASTSGQAGPGFADTGAQPDVAAETLGCPWDDQA